MKKLLVALFVLSLSGNIQAQSRGIASVSFDLFPAGDFTAKSTKLIGKISKKIKGSQMVLTAKNIKVPIKSLDSGIALRDEHLQKRLNPKKSKYITLVSGTAKMKKNAKSGTGTGTFMINGVKKKLPFKVAKVTGDSVTVDLMMKMTDFKLSKASYAGIGVKDQIAVSATIPLK